jgi:hypothetical protein
MLRPQSGWYQEALRIRATDLNEYRMSNDEFRMMKDSIPYIAASASPGLFLSASTLDIQPSIFIILFYVFFQLQDARWNGREFSSHAAIAGG